MKKFVSVIAFTAFIFPAHSQTFPNTGFNISGTIHGFQSGRVLLSFLDGDRASELTSAVKAGKFQLKGRFRETQHVTLSFNNGNYNSSINFFAGNENISVKLDTIFNSQQVIEGSASQEEYKKYKELVAPVEKKSDELNRAGTQLYVSGKLTEPLKHSLFKVHDDYDIIISNTIVYLSNYYFLLNQSFLFF